MKKITSINLSGEDLVKQGPIKGHRLYYSDVEGGMYDNFAKQHGLKWPETIVVYKNGTITQYFSNKDLQKTGSVLCSTLLTHKHALSALIETYRQTVLQLDFYERAITKSAMTQTTNEELANIGECWQKKYATLQTLDAVFQLLYKGLEQQLQEILEKRTGSEKQYENARNVLIAPRNMLRLEQEELDLLNLYVQSTPKSQAEALIHHTENYYWVHTSFAGPKKQTPKQAQERIYQHVKTKKQAKEIIKEQEQEIKKRWKQQEYYKKKLGLTKKEQNIVEMLHDCTEIHDAHVMVTAKKLHAIDCFVKETLRRKKVKKETLLQWTTTEMLAYLQGKTITTRPKKVRVLIAKKGDITELQAKQAQEILQALPKK